MDNRQRVINEIDEAIDNFIQNDEKVDLKKLYFSSNMSMMDFTELLVSIHKKHNCLNTDKSTTCTTS